MRRRFRPREDFTAKTLAAHAPAVVRDAQGIWIQGHVEVGVDASIEP